MIDYLSVKTNPKYEEVDIYDSRNHIHNDSKVSLTFPAEILYTVMQKLKKSSKYARCSFSKCEKRRSTSPRLHQPATPTRLPSFRGLPLTSIFPPQCHPFQLWARLFITAGAPTPCVSLLHCYFIILYKPQPQPQPFAWLLNLFPLSQLPSLQPSLHF